MSFVKNIIRQFNRQCETKENHVDEELKTRYYRVNLQSLFQSVKEIIENDQHAKLVSESIDHGEIAVEINRGKKMFAIITIITVKPYETAVDINVSTEQTVLMGAFPSLKAEIIRIYQELDKKHTYIGVGKHAGE
ncbi:hypothetical protein [Robertmurraya korlensis]|uniref:hypothetical protein n=1 Tax=Robertmurraya korlensis TaxID=519977 RepID=UPI000825E78E|nr:hypothetical protein [Robertmurraya korlensis]